MFRSLPWLIAALEVVSAHTIMQAVGDGSQTNPQGSGIYMPSDDSFIADVASDSLACNGPPVTGFTSSSDVIDVKAGDTVTGAWLHTLTSTGPDSEADNKVIDSSHKGPVLAYMKKVADATQNPSSGPGDGWFKVAESGLISSDEWAVDALISAGGIQSVQIPPCIEDGDYLLRFEIIALHSAYDQGGAQFYMECAQLRVSGGSGSASPDTSSIPGIYSATDPGILINIYGNSGQPYPSSYKIPGPPVFSCGNSPAGNDSSRSSAMPISSVASASSLTAASSPSFVASSLGSPSLLPSSSGAYANSTWISAVPSSFATHYCPAPSTLVVYADVSSSGVADSSAIPATSASALASSSVKEVSPASSATTTPSATDAADSSGYILPTNGTASTTQFQLGPELSAGTACGVDALPSGSITSSAGGSGPGFLYAAINQLAFGANPGDGAGGPGAACGLCYALTPVSASGESLTAQTTTFMIIDECPVTSPNTANCGQCSLSDTNSFGQTFHFDIASDAMNSEQYSTFFNGVTDGSNWNEVHFTQVPCTESKPSVKDWGCVEGCTNNDGASVC